MKMKSCLVVLLVLGFINSKAIAQSNRFGLPDRTPHDTTCDLTKATQASSGLIEKLKLPEGTQLFTYPCTFDKKPYFIAFLGVNFNIQKAVQEGSKLELVFKCTQGNPVGAFVYGGTPIGFETQNKDRSPWFYNSNNGRCFFKGDAGLVHNLIATQNKSLFVVVPPELK